MTVHNLLLTILPCSVTLMITWSFSLEYEQITWFISGSDISVDRTLFAFSLFSSFNMH